MLTERGRPVARCQQASTRTTAFNGLPQPLLAPSGQVCVVLYAAMGRWPRSDIIIFHRLMTRNCHISITGWRAFIVAAPIHLARCQARVHLKTNGKSIITTRKAQPRCMHKFIHLCAPLLDIHSRIHLGSEMALEVLGAIAGCRDDALRWTSAITQNCRSFCDGWHRDAGQYNCPCHCHSL